MTGPTIAMSARGRVLVFRPAAFALLWVVLTEGELQGWWFGVVAVPLATALSHLLLPARGRAGLELLAAVRLAGFFAWQSVVGGVDVARRALDPRLPIRPGMLDTELHHADTSTTLSFAALVSLLPGTICVHIDGHTRIHVVDTSQDVAARLRVAEQRIADAIGPQGGSS